MTSAPASVAPYQPAAHGPVANAVKWAFKMYIRTRMAIDEVVAQANDELSAGSADVPRVEPAVVAGGSDAETVAPHTGAEPTAASEGTRVSWVTAGGIERHEAGELGDLLQREDGFVWVDIPSLDAEAERLL